MPATTPSPEVSASPTVPQPAIQTLRPRTRWIAVVLALLATGCHAPEPPAPTLTWTVRSVDAPQGRMAIGWEMRNPTPYDWAGGQWSLHWNQMGGAIDPESLPEGLSASRKGGDYHVMTSSEDFDLPSGATLAFEFQTRGIIERVIAGPVGMYLVDEVTGRTHPVAFDLKWREAEGLSELGLPTASSRFEAHADLLDPSTLAPAERAARMHKVVPVPSFVRLLPEDSATPDSPLTLPGALRLEPDAAFADLGSLMLEMFDDHPWLGPGYFSGGAQAAPVRIRQVEGLGEEGYRLGVDAAGVEIEATGRNGALYGLMSLSQLVLQAHAPDAVRSPADDWVALEIMDEPFLAYRGMHFDIGRNYFGPEKIAQLLDFMAFFKLNALHLNLTEDEGWRLEIPGLPELTEIGGRRGHTDDERDHLRPAYGSGPDPDRVTGRGGGSGHLTRSDFINLLKAAGRRGIRVIPEVNSPGHSRAAVVAMRARAQRLLAAGDSVEAWRYRLDDPDDRSVYSSAQGYSDNVVNVCLDGSMRFFTKVLDEITAMYEEAGQQLDWFHMGGDEMPYGAWQQSPLCRAFIDRSSLVASADDLAGYYVDQVRRVLSERGIRLVGWEDILLRHSEQSHNEVEISERFLDTDVVPYVWNAAWGWGREDMTYRFANRGFDVVMSNSSAFYFDMTDDADPENYGLDWSGTVNLRDMWRTQPLDLFRHPKLEFEDDDARRDWLRSKERLRPDSRSRFLGIQAQMWTETIRTEPILDEMMMPNLAVFATRAWSRPGAAAGTPDSDGTRGTNGDSVPPSSTDMDRVDRGWENLGLTLTGRVLPMVRETFGGMAYDLPKPGGVLRGGVLHANHILPGMQIRYTLDGSEPGPDSPVYLAPVEVPAGATVRLAAFDHTGRSGRSLLVDVDGAPIDEPFGG